MKRTRALNVSISTVGGAFALAMVAACGSGTVDPTGSGGGSTSAGGTTTGDAAGTTTGAGTTSASGTGGGAPAAPSICDNNIHEIAATNGFVDDFETDTVFPGWY